MVHSLEGIKRYTVKKTLPHPSTCSKQVSTISGTFSQMIFYTVEAKTFLIYKNGSVPYTLTIPCFF